MMVIAIGLSSYNLALFHLVNHAFYKGLLFLGAGAVIHAWADNQDLRKYGGLKAFLPLTYSVMLIASLSLVAFPFMTGFYSKDLILESAYGHFSYSSVVVYFIATIGAMFTTLYSFKVLYLTFFTNPNGPLLNYKKAHEGDIFMSMPLIVLAVFSIFFGYLNKEIFIGLASGFFSDNSIFIHPRHEIILDTEFAVASVFKLLPLALTLVLTVISLLFSEYLPFWLISFKFSRIGYNVFSFLNQRFLIELFYNKYITYLVLKLGGHTTKVLDKGSVELVGPFGLQRALLIVSRRIARLDSGVITSYALYILIGILIYMLIPYFSLLNSLILLFFALALYLALKIATLRGFYLALTKPNKPNVFVSLPLQSSSLYYIFIYLKRWIINRGRLFYSCILVSLVFAFGIRIPFNFFFTIYNILGSPLFYIFFTFLYLLLIYTIRAKNGISKSMSWTEILFAALWGFLIIFVVFNYLRPIYIDSSGVVLTFLLDWLNVFVITHLGEPLFLSGSSTVLFAMNGSSVGGSGSRGTGSGMGAGGRSGSGSGAGGGDGTIDPRLLDIRTAPFVPSQDSPSTQHQPQPQPQAVTQPVAQASASAQPPAPAQPSAPAQGPAQGTSQANPYTPHGRNHLIEQAINAANGGNVNVPDPANQGPAGYLPGGPSRPYNQYIVETIKKIQYHSQFPKLDPVALNWLNGWLAHNKPDKFLPNGDINRNHKNPNSIRPCTLQNLKDMEKED